MRRRFINNHKNKPFDINDYCTIVALEDGVYFDNMNAVLEYCIDGGEWTTLAIWRDSVTINSGQSFSIKARFLDVSSGMTSYNKFNIYGKCKIIGNVMSLLTGGSGKGLKSMEGYGTALSYLFQGCSSIQSVSKDFLPATKLASRCYQGMFSGCTGLTQAPELPATTLARECYEYMFKGCSSLNYIKMLATDISASSCLSHWVDGVSSTGIFVKNKNANWNTTPGALGYDKVPAGWTVVNDGEEMGKVV